MSSLFEYFGCESKEELYNKVKADDKTVRSLVDFIDYSKSSIENPNKPITSPDSFADFVSRIQKPSENEAVLVFVNTKNLPEHFSRINVNDEEEKRLALKESLVARSQSMFIMYDNDVSSYNKNNLERYFKNVDINVVDTFEHSAEEGYIRSKREGIRIPYNDALVSVAEINKGKSYTYDHREMKQFEGYDEFLSYFAEQEINGLNIIDDNNDIKDSLKVGYQDDWQEAFGLITCDQDGDVISVKELFKGTTNSALIDMKVVAKELLTTNNINSLVIFHNHPSGNPEPSGEDLKVTDRLRGICDNLNVELMDHFIVGKENVFSFAKYESDVVSYNEEYQKSLKQSNKNKNINRQREFEL